MGTGLKHSGRGFDTSHLPLVTPCRKVNAWAPLHWVELGYIDFTTAPRESAIYGSIITLFIYALAYLAYAFGSLPFLLALGSSVMFLGPVLAFGLYSISRQIDMGLQPKLGYCLNEGRRHLGNELVFAIVLMVVFLIWARAASIIHIFYPVEVGASLNGFLLYLGIGSLVGALFCLLIFTLSAFSLPMIMDRNVDVITAVVTSIHAVLSNKKAMLVWLGIIAVFLLFSLLTAFLGLVLFLPIIGHATWHAYKAVIDASEWPQHEDV